VITEVPGATAVSKPEPATIVATDVLVLDHVPPVAASVNTVVPPTQTAKVPAMGAEGLTVIIVVATQVDMLYVIKAGPALKPVTTPVAEPIEIVDEVVLQTPPNTELVIVMFEPTHTEDGPLIGDGEALTVTFNVAEQPEIV
jgi:hypothetical protein